MSKNGKIKAIVWILVVVIVLEVLALGMFMISKRKNEEAADKVIALIEQLEEEPITLDSENALVVTKAEYDMLTNKQKKLVANYSVLEKAFDDLQIEKDKKVANELSVEIGVITENSLTAEDVTVAKLMKQYEGLTEAQKGYVENYDLLVKYKNIVDQKIAAKKQQERGRKLGENFLPYEGKWGNFGGHVDTYQGMVEEAIKRDVDYKSYFQGNANDLYFEIYRFEKYGAGFGMGAASFCFSGPSKATGEEISVWGEVMIKQDGKLSCTIDLAG